jgi:RsiW-degrading membrane proteinase PrsW (M82 family)
MLQLIFSFFVLFLVYKIHRWYYKLFLFEGELSNRIQKRAVLWGSIATIILATIFEMILGNIGKQIYHDPKAADYFLTGLAGPFTEEFFKMLVPLYCLLFLQIRSCRTLFVLGALSGIGFFFTESSIALLAGAKVDSHSLAYNLVGMGIVGSIVHPISTGTIGLGLGLAAKTKSKLLFLIVGILGFFAGFAFHFFNNTLGFLVNEGNIKNTVQFNYFGKLFFLLFIMLAVARFFRHKKIEQLPVIAAAPVT